MTGIELRPIGVIHSPYRTKEETPIQGVFRPEGIGWVEIYPAYEEGLKDIEGFSHIFLIYNFDKATARAELVRPVLLDDQPHGIFACRFPSRPNGIGITVVKLLGKEGSKLKVGGIDVLDNTPLLDIKPYVPRFDSFPQASEGWFKGKNERPKPPGREQ